MNSIGLVELPEGPSRGLIQGLVMAFVLLSSLSIILGTTYLDIRYKLPDPKLIGDEGVAYSNMKRDAKWSDGSMARLIEYEHRTRSKTRAWLGPRYSSFMFRVLNETGKDVLYGKEGWLFYTKRAVMPEWGAARGVHRAAAAHGALARRFQSMGVQLVVMAVPRKAAIAGEFLPLGYESHREVDEGLIKEFRKRGVDVVDLFPAWDVPGDEPVYQRRDTHWSKEGVRRSAMATVEHLGLLAPPSQRYGKINDRKRVGRPGAMYSLFDTEPKPADLLYAERVLSVIKDGRPAPTGGPNARIVACGTSFSANTIFAKFLSHYLGEKVQSFDFPGRSAVFALRKMLQGREESGLPEIVVEEIPNNQIIDFSLNENSWPLGRDLVDIFSRLVPDRMFPLAVPEEALKIFSEPSKPLSIDKTRNLAQIPEGWLAHSGGGCVELAVDIQVTKGQGAIVFRHGAMNYTSPCKQGFGRYITPLLSSEAGAQGVSVFMKPIKGKGPVTFFVKGVAPVSALDGDTAIAGNIYDLHRENKHCTQQLDFPNGTMVTPQGTLILKTESGVGKWTEVRVVVQTSDGMKSQAFDFPMIRRGGWVVLVPGALAGKELGKVTISGMYSGKGKASTWLVNAQWLQVRAE